MIVQGSPEWFAARLGKVTASRVCDVVAKTTSGWGASRVNYMADLVGERLTGEPAECYVSPEMRRGTELESEARVAYTFHANVDVDQVGFVPHPTIPMSGASPDGLVGDDGIVEIKCPNKATHIQTLEGKRPWLKYEPQMQWQMACTGRRWCDFVSYDPRMPGNMRLYVTRRFSDPARIAALEEHIREFLAELDEKVAILCRLYGKPELVAAE
jgi:putative phage-type endonuclease